MDIIEANGHSIDAEIVRKALEEWSKYNCRAFPWRDVCEPYRILMSEVMLHRTQAIQVVPVFNKFLISFPDIITLAKASKAELQEILYSLGLRWRIDLIHDMAVRIVEHHDGIIPQGKAELISLPGVSEYIAGAVRCFTWNFPEPIFDTNTVRVAGRLFGLEAKPSSRRNRTFQALVSALLDVDQPRSFNYSLLDFAALICTKRPEPQCEICPLLLSCRYGRVNLSLD